MDGGSDENPTGRTAMSILSKEYTHPDGYDPPELDGAEIVTAQRTLSQLIRWVLSVVMTVGVLMIIHATSVATSTMSYDAAMSVYCFVFAGIGALSFVIHEPLHGFAFQLKGYDPTIRFRGYALADTQRLSIPDLKWVLVAPLFGTLAVIAVIWGVLMFTPLGGGLIFTPVIVATVVFTLTLCAADLFDLYWYHTRFGDDHFIYAEEIQQTQTVFVNRYEVTSSLYRTTE